MSAKAVTERVKGTNDVLGERYRLSEYIRRTLNRCFESYGYVGIDVPVLEHTDLFLRKSGSEVVAKLYSFADQGGRQVSMRPEFTASVIRAYVEHGQSLPLPVRWHYAGPVFRYERPQRSRFRQFAQQGVELIGGNGPWADAEALLLACRGVQELGLEGFRVVVGHVGAILQLLEHLQLSDRVKAFLLANLEDLSKKNRGVENVKRRMAELGLVESDETDPELRSLLSLLDERQARLVIRGLLSGMNMEVGGSREPDEIVDRFMRKLRGNGESERVGKALDFIARLGQIEGAPAEAFDAAKSLSTEYGIDAAGLDDLRECLEFLADYLGDKSKVVVDFGLARGLAYYSGMVFEIHHGDLQICGGGRYDGLARALGARDDTPALGFAFGVERLAEAMVSGRKTDSSQTAGVTDVLVVAEGPAAQARALRVAESLRASGKIVEVDARGRSVKSNLDYANKRHISTVVIVPNVRNGSDTYLVRDMATGEEKHVAICPT